MPRWSFTSARRSRTSVRTSGSAMPSWPKTSRARCGASQAVDLDQTAMKPVSVKLIIRSIITTSLSLATNSINPNTLRAFAGIALTLLVAVAIIFIYSQYDEQLEDYPQVTTQYLPKPAPGCRAREDLDRLLDLWENEEARANFLALALQSGRCVTLDKGTEVVIEQAPLTSENLCVRPAGEANCVWTNSGWIERPAVRYRGHNPA